MKPHVSTRPPKWPFLLADAALLTVAIVIGFLEPGPLSDTALVLIFSCVFIGAALAVTPFFLDFSAARHEDLIEAREQLEALAQRLADSADILGTAAAQLQAAGEATTKAVHLAEGLPYKMQEKMGELTQLLQQGQDDEKETMSRELEELREAEGRRLETVAEKIRAATKEMSALEKETRAGLDAAVKRVQDAEKSLTAATASLERRMIAANAEASDADTPPRSAKTKPAAAEAEKAVEPKTDVAAHAPEPTQEKAAPKPSKTKPLTSESVGQQADQAEPATEPEGKKQATKPRATTKAPKIEKGTEPEPADDEPARSKPASPSPSSRKKPPKAGDDDNLPGLDPIVVRDDDAESDGQAAKTSDGSTRLLVTAYIGIGNKVFVRGDGPGLKPDKGQPMEFVSIGKWLWQTSDATAPVTLQVYKNDEIKAAGDEITIDPGHHVEATPVFREANPF